MKTDKDPFPRRFLRYAVKIRSVFPPSVSCERGNFDLVRRESRATKRNAKRFQKEIQKAQKQVSEWYVCVIERQEVALLLAGIDTSSRETSIWKYELLIPKENLEV